MNRQRCPYHGREYMYSHDVQLGGVWLGVYVCPEVPCDSIPDFGKPQDHPSRKDDMDDDDLQAGELVAA